MYEYKFIKIKASIWNRLPTKNYRGIIIEEAQDGWRLTQIFAPSAKVAAHPAFYELIFERKLPENSNADLVNLKNTGLTRLD